MQGLEAGADDFLSKPVDDVALVTRVKNLARLKVLSDEMMMRAKTTQQMRDAGAAPIDWAEAGNNGRILVVDDVAALGAAPGGLAVEVCTRSKSRCDPRRGDQPAVAGQLRLRHRQPVDGAHGRAAACARRCAPSIETRHLPIMIIVEPGEDARLLRALDMGVNDYLTRPLDRNEVVARVRTQVARKRHTDVLRSSIEQSVEMAITDGLTGLHNRRYMESHLRQLVKKAGDSGRPLSVLVADIDFFKRVNDTYGHDAGDAVLREFAARFRRNTRGIDLACRMGGEEFVIIMPDTDMRRAPSRSVSACARALPPSRSTINSETRLRVTASVGLATLERASDTPETLFKRADLALYAAKRDGRNRVVADAA